MLLADVNILIYAHRAESVRSSDYRDWLLHALEIGGERFGYSEAILSSFVRIVTNRRVFGAPTPLADAFAFCRDILRSPNTVRIEPGPRHWSIFEDLCRDVDAKANLVPNAYLAALAIEHGATWVTNDRGFARFPGLRWKRPLEG